MEVGPAFREMREDFPDRFPYAIFPEPGGLLEWGGNLNGDRCFWLTEDPDPDRWPVVVWFRGEVASRSWRREEGGMAAFLLRVVRDPKSALLASSEERLTWIFGG